MGGNDEATTRLIAELSSNEGGIAARVVDNDHWRALDQMRGISRGDREGATTVEFARPARVRADWKQAEANAVAMLLSTNGGD